MENRQLKFSSKIPYDLVAEPLLRRDKLREATSKNLQFPDRLPSLDAFRTPVWKQIIQEFEWLKLPNMAFASAS
jgi:hypothetical protein